MSCLRGIGDAVIVNDVTVEELTFTAERMMAMVARQDVRVSMEETRINPGARPANEETEAAAAAHVQAIFDSIAPSYDLLNHLLSMGLDRRWWGRAARSFRDVLARPDARVLDLCCGTGDMTAALLKERPVGGVAVTGLDFSGEMLERARVKYAGRMRFG